MSRNRFHCLAITTLFTFTLSACKSSNSASQTSSAGPTDANATSASNASSASNSMTSAMGSTNLLSQLGGTDKVQSLASSFLGNVKSDSRTSNLVAGQDTSSLTGKLSDQLCSMLGGNCKAPLTNDQVDAASKKVSPETNSALSDSFSKSLDSVTSSSTVKDMITKTIGPKIGGVLTGLTQK